MVQALLLLRNIKRENLFEPKDNRTKKKSFCSPFIYTWLTRERVALNGSDLFYRVNDFLSNAKLRASCALEGFELFAKRFCRLKHKQSSMALPFTDLKLRRK